MNNLVSVLCPNYNNEQFLKRCIDSILNQKTSFNYKIIFIDDCSNDNSVQIIKSYMKNNPQKIQLLQNKTNCKLLPTILRGYKQIKTKYWTVLDPDDYWINENFLQDAVDFLERHKDFSVYMGNTYIVKNDQQKLNISFESKDFSFDKLDNIVYGHTSATLFRNFFSSDDFKKLDVAAQSPEKQACFRGDTFRNILAVSKGNGHFEQKVYSVYNYNQQGIWSKLSPEQQEIMGIRAYLEYIKYFEKKNVEFFLKQSYRGIQKLLASAFYSSEFEKLLKTWLQYARETKYLNKLGILENFCFFYPSRNIGGYQYLFINLAKNLANLGFDVSYIDYPEKTLARQELKTTKVKLLDYSEDMTLIDDDKAFNVIVPITRAYNNIPKFKNLSSKLYFFVAHHKSFEWTKNLSKLDQQSMYDLINTLNINKAMCYMDSNSFIGMQQYVSFPLYKCYVPIACESTTTISNPCIINNSEINIGWLGRLDADKINSINNILKNYHQYKTNKKKKYHIIGQGSAINAIKADEYPEIEVIFTGPMVGKARDEYMSKNIDLFIGEGTALLNAASLCIPTLNGINCMYPFDEKKFIWIFNLKEYLLGCHKEQFHLFNNKTTSLAVALDDIYKNNKKEFLGKLSQKHITDNHSMNKTTIMFTNFIFNGGFSIKDYFNKKLIPFQRKRVKMGGGIQKLQYKIWKHLDKKLRKKGIIQ